jgi:hypothetical protein
VEEIYQLVDFMDKNKIRHLEVFKDNSRLKAFFELVREKKFKSDEEAAEHFFGKHPYRSMYYHRLKKQLRERLINLLFIIEFNESTSLLHKEAHLCFKNAAAVNIMLQKFLRSAAIELAEDTIKIAIKNQLTDITLLLARHLASHYGGFDQDKKKFKAYNELVDRCYIILRGEILSERYAAELLSIKEHEKTLNPSYSRQVEGYIKELEFYTERYESMRLIVLAYNVFITYYEMTRDYRKVIKVCQEVLEKLSQKHYKSHRSANYTFLHRQLGAHIILQEYQKGEEIANITIEFTEKHTNNWYQALNRTTVLHLHRKDYETAAEFATQALNSPNLSKQTPVVFEQWKINEALLHYLVLRGKLKKEALPTRDFRIKRFLNEVPAYAKDKRGRNITLIVIQMLYLLHNKDHDQIIDRVDSLKQYAYRHLQQDSTYRSNCFIKMLLQLPNSYQKRVAFERKALPFYQKLLSVPLSKAQQAPEIETIPYETLYEFICESLD